MYIISSRTNRLLYLIIVLMTSISAVAQSSDKNYVLTKTFLDENGSTFVRHIDYYDESVTYNANGSITSLLRSGMKNDGTFSLIDDLTITYDGNRLLKVTDDSESLNYNGALDFNDGADTDVEYAYDGNGALTQDKNRGITSITYDYGHHPSTIRNATERKRINNDYTPDGRKLSSNHSAFVPNGTGGYSRILIQDLYVDGLMIRNGSPLLWQFDGGYVDLDANGTATCWNYYITDHLGSTRMVVSSNDSIRETINYYPFGSEMRMAAPSQMTGGTSHPFRFTGKELDKLNGLNLYDFGARWYDVAGVPMWTSVDPLAEKYYNVTPYSYCAGDPVNKFDPDGRVIVIEYKASNSKYYSLSINGSGKYVYPKSQFVKDFFAAYNYNIKNGGGEYMKKAAEDPHNIFYLRDATDPNAVEVQETGFNPQEGKSYITWESRMGLETTEGGHQSAATRLEHEFYHAVDNVQNPSLRRTKSMTPDSQYDYLEEREAVDAENKTAIHNNEAPRYDHKGNPYPTISPTSIIPRR